MRTVLGRDPRSGACLAVTVTDGRVRLVEPAATTTTEGLPWVSPGLTDLQVNGFHGHELNDPSLSTEAIDALRRALRAEGVTTFVPTVISGSRDHTAAILRALARARRQSTALREAIPYVHLEGPYISAEEGPRGCHDPRHIRRPDADEFAAWQEQAEGAIGMVTLSPHWAEAIDFTARLHRAGVRVSIGHTHAGPERIAEAVAAGARFSTHLGNGAHATLPRHPNYLWAQLADRRLTAGFIADGHHLDGATLTAMLRAKGLAHAFLVSDVTS
ncbi:MAG TPA: amidohydrolase family protein, partial [Microbacteriaceae bacterium]|nr:amidohydrolase family protein [Microbacteriaceae bacterium]